MSTLTTYAVIALGSAIGRATLALGHRAHAHALGLGQLGVELVDELRGLEHLGQEAILLGVQGLGLGERLLDLAAVRVAGRRGQGGRKQQHGGNAHPTSSRESGRPAVPGSPIRVRASNILGSGAPGRTRGRHDCDGE